MKGLIELDSSRKKKFNDWLSNWGSEGSPLTGGSCLGQGWGCGSSRGMGGHKKDSGFSPDPSPSFGWGRGETDGHGNREGFGWSEEEGC